MSPAAQQPPLLTSLLIYVVIGAIILFRYSRPMKMSIARLFIAPIVLLVITVLSIYGTQTLNPAPAWAIAVAIALGIAFGTPVGILSSRHRVVRRTEKRHVMYVEPSWITAAIWIAAFVVKSVIRSQVHGGVVATIAGDGLLLFGIASVLASYWVLYHKFRALDEEQQPQTA